MRCPQAVYVYDFIHNLARSFLANMIATALLGLTVATVIIIIVEQ